MVDGKETMAFSKGLDLRGSRARRFFFFFVAFCCGGEGGRVSVGGVKSLVGSKRGGRAKVVGVLGAIEVKMAALAVRWELHEERGAMGSGSVCVVGGRRVRV